MSARKVLEESQGQTERTDFPQSGQECPKGDGKRKGLHPGMAGLHRDSEHEDDNGRLGRVATLPLSDVHLEAVEESKNKSQKSDEIGNSGMASLRSGVLWKSLLESSTSPKRPMGNLKQKTRTGRILQHP